MLTNSITNVFSLSSYIRVILNQFTVEACIDVKSSEIVYLNLECVLYSAHMDARSGVIAGDLHLEDTKFDGKWNSILSSISVYNIYCFFTSCD